MSANELAILTVIVDTAPLSNSYGFGPEIFAQNIEGTLEYQY